MEKPSRSRTEYLVKARSQVGSRSLLQPGDPCLVDRFGRATAGGRTQPKSGSGPLARLQGLLPVSRATFDGEIFSKPC